MRERKARYNQIAGVRIRKCFLKNLMLKINQKRVKPRKVVKWSKHAFRCILEVEL